MKKIISALSLSISISCFANIKFSENSEKTVKLVMNDALSKSEAVGADSPIIKCLQKFRVDMANENGDLNQLLSTQKYAEVKKRIESLSNFVKMDSRLNLFKSNAIDIKSLEAWKYLRIETFHFIGEKIVEFTEKRFSKQSRGERDIEAWIRRNNQMDPERDFVNFIAGFAGQFLIVEMISEEILDSQIKAS